MYGHSHMDLNSLMNITSIICQINYPRNVNVKKQEKMDITTGSLKKVLGSLAKLEVIGSYQ